METFSVHIGKRAFFKCIPGLDMGAVSLNFYDSAKAEILAHIGFRPQKRILAVNSYVDDAWGQEARFPLEMAAGRPVYFSVLMHDRRLSITVVGGEPVELKLPGGRACLEIAFFQGDDGISLVADSREAATIKPVLDKYGMGHAWWLYEFPAQEFSSLNQHQGMALTTEALLSDFLSTGIRTLLPYSNRPQDCFDVDFYRVCYPDLAEYTDQAAYSHWIAHGRMEGRFPSAKAVFAKFDLALDRLPPAFSKETYAQHNPAAGPMETDWLAFLHYLTTGLDAGYRLHLSLSDTGDNGPAVTFLRELAGLAVRKGRPKIATALLKNAIELNPDDLDLHKKRADLLLQVGAPERALPHLEKLAKAHPHDPAVHMDLCRGYMGLEDFDTADIHIRQALSRAPDVDKPVTTALFRDYLRARFEHGMALAHMQKINGNRKNATHIVDRTAGFYAENLPSFAPLSRSALAEKEKPSVLILAHSDLPQCLHYRVEQKLDHLRAEGHRAAWVPEAAVADFMDQAPQYDIALFYRVKATPEVMDAIFYARSLGMACVYDIDDLIFDPLHFPADFGAYDGQLTYRDYARLVCEVPLYRRAMALCDYAMASTSPLADLMAPIVGKQQSDLVPNAVDTRHRAFLRDYFPDSQNDKTDVTLFYGSATLAHNEDFRDLAAPALQRVMEDNPSVRLVLAGHVSLPPAFSVLRERVIRLPGTISLDSYWSLLAEADVNLSVLSKSPVNDCKSEIKWLEAAMMGIPSVVSGTEVFKKSLMTDTGMEGETVLVAETVEDWQQALSRLVADADMRRAIGTRARAFCEQHYGFEPASVHLGATVKAIHTGHLKDYGRKGGIFKRQAKLGTERPKVLIVGEGDQFSSVMKSRPKDLSFECLSFEAVGGGELFVRPCGIGRWLSAPGVTGALKALLKAAPPVHVDFLSDGPDVYLLSEFLKGEGISYSITMPTEPPARPTDLLGRAGNGDISAILAARLDALACERGALARYAPDMPLCKRVKDYSDQILRTVVQA